MIPWNTETLTLEKEGSWTSFRNLNNKEILQQAWLIFFSVDFADFSFSSKTVFEQRWFCFSFSTNNGSEIQKFFWQKLSVYLSCG